MEFRVSGLNDVGQVAQDFDPDMIISITDPGYEEMADEAIGNVRAKLLKLSFHDIDEIRKGYVAPSLTDVEKVKNFISENRKNGSEKVIVHCHAGMSRSPMIALYAIIHEEVGIKKSSETAEMASSIAGSVCEMSPFMIPNKRIKKMILRDFGRFGACVIRSLDARIEEMNSKEPPIELSKIW